MLRDIPHVSSPLTTDCAVAGSKEMPIELEGIAPAEKRLSVTVGTVDSESGERVNTVRPTGPILTAGTLVQCLRWHRLGRMCTHPRIPSTPVNPLV